jgi:signal transduction protein with GAF and PtsI domain
MMGAGAWLAGLMAPLAARVLMALGFQVVTITGMAVVVGQLKTMVLSQFGAIPAAYLQLVLLSGVGTALGIIFGAIATRMAIWQIQQGAKIVGVGS